MSTIKSSIKWTYPEALTPEHNNKGDYKYSSPLPQVLMIIAIVVGFATLSVGLALVSRISRQFSTISESQIHFNTPSDE